MKLRYYMRGLGIGIVVTALIMGMTTEAGRPLTDAEIRAKALTLGMVDADSMSLSSLGGTSSPSAETPGPGDENTSSGSQEQMPSNSPDVQGTEEPSESPDVQESEEPSGNSSPAPEVPTTSPVVTESPTPSITPTPTPSSTPMTSATSNPTATSGPVSTVEIRIVYGDSSYTVSRRLEEAGLVDSASEYDKYLVDNGYSKTIRTGTYQIPSNATWEEIAEIIS